MDGNGFRFDFNTTLVPISTRMAPFMRALGPDSATVAPINLFLGSAEILSGFPRIFWNLTGSLWVPSGRRAMAGSMKNVAGRQYPERVRAKMGTPRGGSAEYITEKVEIYSFRRSVNVDFH